jgi:hypothetical protein
MKTNTIKRQFLKKEKYIFQKFANPAQLVILNLLDSKLRTTGF